jgi:hypothetical protein
MGERHLLELLAQEAPNQRADCADRVIAAARRRRHRTRAVVLSCAAVRPGAHLRAGDGNVVRNAVVVTLGDAVIAGHSARVPIAASCGPLCGRGQTLTLERLDGTWTVTGTTGTEWIS